MFDRLLAVDSAIASGNLTRNDLKSTRFPRLVLENIYILNVWKMGLIPVFYIGFGASPLELSSRRPSAPKVLPGEGYLFNYFNDDGELDIIKISAIENMFQHPFKWKKLPDGFFRICRVTVLDFP